MTITTHAPPKNVWHYAVVVGIDRYPGISDLKLPREDARAFRKWLLAPNGGNLPEENIETIILDEDAPTFEDPLQARPEAPELDKALARINRDFKQRVNDDPDGLQDSRLYLYASGHGIVGSEGLGAVLFAAADPVQNYWDGAEIAEYKQWYITAKLFKQVLIFTDCCRERRPQAPPMRPRLGREVDFAEPATVYVMFGAELGHRAFEPDPQQLDDARGYFTRALLKGLNGDAVNPHTGQIDGYSLFKYVKNSVTALTDGTTFPQRPDQDGNPEIVIHTPRGQVERTKREVTLVFPAGYAGRVAVWRDGTKVGEHDAGTGPWTLSLEEGVAYFAQSLEGGPPFKNGGAFHVFAEGARVEL